MSSGNSVQFSIPSPRHLAPCTASRIRTSKCEIHLLTVPSIRASFRLPFCDRWIERAIHQSVRPRSCRCHRGCPIVLSSILCVPFVCQAAHGNTGEFQASKTNEAYLTRKRGIWKADPSVAVNNSEPKSYQDGLPPAAFVSGKQFFSIAREQAGDTMTTVGTMSVPAATTTIATTISRRYVQQQYRFNNSIGEHPQQIQQHRLGTAVSNLTGRSLARYSDDCKATSAITPIGCPVGHALRDLCSSRSRSYSEVDRDSDSSDRAADAVDRCHRVRGWYCHRPRL